MIKPLSSLVFLVLLHSAVLGQERRFQVVALLPLTGALSEYGVAARNGFEMARKENPGAFENVRFAYDDSKYDSKTALSSYRKFRTQEKTALFYVWGYGICQALAPLAEIDRFPMIAASAERGVSAGRSYVLRFNYFHEQISASLLDYLRSRGVKRIAVVKTELAYFNGVLEGMKSLLKEGETLEVLDSFDIAEMDFRPAIGKLRTRAFDALGVFLVGGQGSQFYRQLDQLKFKPETFGTDFFDSDTVAREAAGAMDGVVFATQETTPRFRERYRKAFGNDRQAAWAANAYEFAMLIARSFGAKADAVPPEEVISRLSATQAASAGAAGYEFSGVGEGPGFNFRVILRKIAGDSVRDLQSQK